MPYYVDFASVVREGGNDDNGAALVLWIEPSGGHRRARFNLDWWRGYSFPYGVPRMAVEKALPVDFFQLYRHRADLEKYAREKGLTETWPTRPGADYTFTFRKLDEGRFTVRLTREEALEAGVEEFWFKRLDPEAK